ncbi:biotin-dependent carboxyltransferase family protein [Flavobacteriaceae bacterium]|nr:biotin-dependent carboxyltransferase family protein [Flavobacteriaceae bacterium]
MAIQLSNLLVNNLDSIITSLVIPGTVQLTPNGRLIILMRDCQTTGGYPRILQLTEKSINCLAQLKKDSSLSFSLKI